MKKNFSKLLALYLPYLLLGLAATNFGEAWRLAEGKEMGDKIHLRNIRGVTLCKFKKNRTHSTIEVQIVLFFIRDKHLRLMHSPGKKRALCDGGFRTLYVRRRFSRC